MRFLLKIYTTNVKLYIIKEKNYISINYNYSMAHYFHFIKGKKRIKTNNNYIKSKKK